MKHFLSIVLFSFANLVFAQSNLPWELERFDYGYYGSPGMNLQLIEDESAVFDEYYKVYKQRRAEEPQLYFPSPGPYQYRIKEYLSDANSTSDLLLLANFLESGSDQLLEELADSPYQSSATLPYRFIAALIDNNNIKAAYYLDQMDDNGMISSVLKAWGNNVLSLKGQNIYMTHGLQDLIGLSWALSESDKLSRAIIYNGYLNTITSEFEDEDAFLKTYPSAWISPTYNAAFLDQNIKDLRLSGIGFKLMAGKGNAESEFIETLEGFRGMNLECPTPADAGLVSSYTYFLNQVELLIKKDNREELKSFANQLAGYIEKTSVAK